MELRVPPEGAGCSAKGSVLLLSLRTFSSLTFAYLAQLTTKQEIKALPRTPSTLLSQPSPTQPSLDQSQAPHDTCSQLPAGPGLRGVAGCRGWAPRPWLPRGTGEASSELCCDAGTKLLCFFTNCRTREAAFQPRPRACSLVAVSHVTPASKPLLMPLTPSAMPFCSLPLTWGLIPAWGLKHGRGETEAQEHADVGIFLRHKCVQCETFNCLLKDK